MKHLEVGVIIAIVLALVLAVLAVAWWFFNLLLGPVAATVAITVVVLVALAAIVIDWKTENKE